MPSIHEQYSSGVIKGITPPTDDDIAFYNATPTVYEANPDIIGVGAGQVSLPFLAILELDPGFGSTESQTTGDCYLGSLGVTMSDGSQRQIKDVRIGEYVISGENKTRKVTDFIKKKYNGKMIRLYVEGYPIPLEATPDHKFITYPNLNYNNDDINKYETQWKKIEDLEVGEYLCLAKGIDEKECQTVTFDMVDYCEQKCITGDLDFKALRLEPVDKGYIRAKNGRTQIKRFVDLDEKLAWLLGLYLAEGGVDGVNGYERITFNLGSHEAVLAEQTKQYFKDVFDIDARIYQVPSKPSVIYVRIHNVIIANFFKSLCPGIVYNKNISNHIFKTERRIRLSLLKGWMDGDGYIKNDYNRSNGISVSWNLVYQLARLSRTCGLQFYWGIVPEYEGHVESYTLHFNHISTSTIFDVKIKPEIRIKKDLLVENGQIVKIVKIEEFQCPDDYVYCLEVENDHSFVANGYIGSNCVSHGTRNAGSIDYGLDALFGETKFEGRLCTENLYGARGHGGQGANCSTLTKYVSTSGPGGFLVRKRYSSGSNSVDLSVYNGSIGHNWGRSGTPSWLNNIAANNKALQVYSVSHAEMVRDTLAAGHGVHICSGYGFSSTRDANGVSRQSGSWSHDMAWIAVDDTPWAHSNYGGMLFLVQNSWGRWNSGGKRYNQPDGSFWIRESDATKMLRSGDSWAICSVVGIDRIYPLKRLKSKLDYMMI